MNFLHDYRCKFLKFYQSNPTIYKKDNIIEWGVSQDYRIGLIFENQSLIHQTKLKKKN